MFNLSGCVGYTYTRNGDVVTSETDFSRTNLSIRSKPPLRAADKINPDGTETFLVDDNTRWCGLTLWAIIPIPLWLPVCSSYTEVTFKEEKPTKVSSRWVSTSGFVCGPLVPLIRMESGFCQHHNGW